ncbi:MAG: iron-containing alcohol dehydrogenase [Acidobacteriia bacterium]|nr:iron-containing alcohol dehydrogenase [Terriglobia bacterium]
MRLQLLKRVLFPPEVCTGKGSVERLACLDPARVLVVTGSSGRRCGALERVTAQLKDAKAEEVLELESGEPRAAAITAAREKVAAFDPEWIVAVGGGAVLDAAKFLWAQLEHPDLVFLAKAVPIGPLRGKARFVAIPTTAGSGSEASQAAVLAGDDGTKIPYVSPHWVPDIAILDPALTVSLPRETTVATGFDALTHAVESAVSNLGNPFLRVLAATSVGLVLRHLPAAAENPQDLVARAGMLEAAFLGGLCQSMTSTGAAHALSHAASKLHRAPHGAATGFFLLPTMRWNQKKNAALYDELAVNCGLTDGAALEAAFLELVELVGLPQRFEELLGRVPDATERQTLAETAAKDVCLRTNACRLGTPDLAQLLAEIG